VPLQWVTLARVKPAVLEDRGYRVSTVPDGASMRDFLRSDDRVDAIVLDAITPGENGASLALHAKRPSTSRRHDFWEPRDYELRRGARAPAASQAVSGGGALRPAECLKGGRASGSGSLGLSSFRGCHRRSQIG
jgi:hypothetical protein